MSTGIDSSQSESQSQAIRHEIDDLERRLVDAKARLNGGCAIANEDAISSVPKVLPSHGPLTTSSHHFLLLLSDSALPLGSFAFSSGLESYLAHTRPASSFPAFLEFSLASYASTTLPFVLATHRNPIDLVELDDTLDAAIMCTVGRRASVAQGRALLSIWDRSFSTAVPVGDSAGAVEMLKELSVLLRSTSSVVSGDLPTASAHLGPLFGAIACVLGMSLQQTAYVFMLSHVKSLLSAAVRASVFGPYHAQKVLASVEVQDGIRQAIAREWDTKIEDAGQSVPVMDLWIGRHEMLYSRIFNS
ncbi:putative urease accessory protein UreF-like [Lachnellula hyalina]|uniref:Putative urease accessory protein UreF-like n=1 Tax=Lachnellula hyalina TaxID=1316788 RepID=A0A8H8R279_9HELO|nr:putative urease accessory protein UreF-like [Lachnellula hyalina]TVY26100.1 putative urease accessory protein UreF-like [Lachnellula hyalina]